MKKLLFLSKKEYVLTAFFLVISTFLFVFFTLSKVKEYSMTVVESSLQTVNHSSQEALNQWLSFRKNNIEELSKNAFVVEKAVALSKIPQDSASLVSSPHTAELRAFFQPILELNEDLGVFFITKDYKSIFSMRDANTGSFNIMAKQSKNLLDKVRTQKKTVFIPPIKSDVVLDSKYGQKVQNTMFIVAPVISQGEVIVAFSLRIDIYKDFSRIFGIGRIGETGETVGCDQAGKLVTTSVFKEELISKGMIKKHQDVVRNIVYKTIAERESSISVSSSFNEVKDYRGKKVFSVQTWNSDLNIWIVSKIDKDEALVTYYFIRKVMISSFIVAIIGGLVLLGIIIRLRNKNERSLVEANARLEDMVEKRTEELQHTINTKDRFFLIIAHDLRSPLSSLLSFLDVLVNQRHQLAEKEKDKLFEELLESTNSAFEFLENLLTWSNSQVKGIALNPEDVVLANMVARSINLQKQFAQNKNITLLSEVPSDLQISVDKNMLNTVLRNLISNAIKFTSRGGEVKVSASLEEKFVKITVEDSGKGMTKENLSELFRVDKKVSTKGTENEPGTGLGSIICKEFVEMNHGEISVESKLGVGTKITLHLPKHST